MTDSTPDIAPSEKKKRMTRAQKVSRTRQALLDAAMRVVGESGHSEASIANITREAKVALGTFYMHFESKQALLEELLPWAGGLAHAFMDDAIEGTTTYLEFEVRNFDALLEFSRRQPYYFRLLSESEVATPDAYQAHIERSIERYTRELVKAHGRGELPQYTPDDFEVLATMLTSIKLLLFVRFNVAKRPPANLREVYLSFVMNGVLGNDSAVRAQLLMLAAPKRKRRTAL
jgi:AcrR family transcriptional regulator